MPTEVTRGAAHVSRAVALPGISQTVREERSKVREKALREASDAAMRAGGFTGKSTSDEFAAPVVADLGGVAERLAGDRKRFDGITEPVQRILAERRIAAAEQRVEYILSALGGLGWRYKGTADGLVAACRATHIAWTDAKRAIGA